MILVDQGNIRTGSARAVMNSAKRFVDTLTPEDRVAVVAIPGPGELVDFTNNHDRVREALLRIVGQASAMRSRFNLSITEAMAIYMRCRCAAGPSGDPPRMRPGASPPPKRNAASAKSNRTPPRWSTKCGSARRIPCTACARSSRASPALEGPKSVILISEGLIFEGLGTETDDLASVAADSRATLDILLLDVPMFDVAQSQRPTTPREDRNLQVTGLEQLAGASRGELYRINTSAEYAFDRISRSLDGYYLLGVESRPDDRDGRRHRLTVKTHATRHLDPIAAHVPHHGVGEGDDPDRRGEPGDSIAAAHQRPADEGLDLDLQGAGQQQGSRADRG